MSLSEIKTNRSYLDSLFDFKHSNTMELSIQLGLDGLYLAILDSRSNTFVGLKEYIFDGLQGPYQIKEEFEKLVIGDQEGNWE